VTKNYKKILIGENLTVTFAFQKLPVSVLGSGLKNVLNVEI
jgi:hypothetical protein